MRAEQTVTKEGKVRLDKRKLTFKVEQEMTREQMPLISKQKSSQTPRTPEIGAKTRHQAPTHGPRYPVPGSGP